MFGVFSKVIAFACIGLWFAAVRTISDAILAQASGGASPAGFVRPMSRRQIIKRRELRLPQGPDWHSDSHHPKRAIGFEDRLQAESCRVAVPVSCEIEEPPRCWTLKPIHTSAVMPAVQADEPPGAGLATTNGLLASLVFRQVRPRNRSAAHAAERNRSSHDPKPRPVSVAVTIGQAGSQDQGSGAVETLFTELAARRLGSLAARERPE